MNGVRLAVTTYPALTSTTSHAKVSISTPGTQQRNWPYKSIARLVRSKHHLSIRPLLQHLLQLTRLPKIVLIVLFLPNPHLHASSINPSLLSNKTFLPFNHGPWRCKTLPSISPLIWWRSGIIDFKVARKSHSPSEEKGARDTASVFGRFKRSDMDVWSEHQRAKDNVLLPFETN